MSFLEENPDPAGEAPAGEDTITCPEPPQSQPTASRKSAQGKEPIREDGYSMEGGQLANESSFYGEGGCYAGSNEAAVGGDADAGRPSQSNFRHITATVQGVESLVIPEREDSVPGTTTGEGSKEGRHEVFPDPEMPDAGCEWGSAGATQSAAEAEPGSTPEAQLADEAKSAVKIQAAVRGRQARKALAKPLEPGIPTPAAPEDLSRAREAASAVRIQAAFRGLHARKTLAQQRQEKGRAPSGSEVVTAATRGAEAASAIRIQAAVRGKIARKRVTGMKLEEVNGGLSVHGEGSVSMEAAGKGLARGSRADALVSGGDLGEGWDEERAAIRIQAAVRGRQARAGNAGRRGNGDVGGKLAPSVNDGMTDNIGVAAASATKIQAMVRGRQARRALEIMAIEKRVAEVSAIKIQAMVRGRQARRALHNRAAEEESSMLEARVAEVSATKIQAVVRGRQARRALAGAQRSLGLEEKGTCGGKGAPAAETGEGRVDEGDRAAASATKIQAVVGGRQARRALGDRVTARNEAKKLDLETLSAVRIQAAVRGRQVRRALAVDKVEVGADPETSVLDGNLQSPDPSYLRTMPPSNFMLLHKPPLATFTTIRVFV
jgi:hypothetical protein